jgi:DNA-binding NtrC family response regulator
MLLITDVVMPDLNGPHLAEELARRIPGLRVILMSGWEPRVIAHEGAYRYGYPTLAKPFTAKVLLDEVSAILQRPTSAGRARTQSPYLDPQE